MMAEPVKELKNDLEKGLEELPPSGELATEGAGVLPEDSADELSEVQPADIIEEAKDEDLTWERVLSIVEGVLFASDRPVSIDSLKTIFKNTTIKTKDIRKALEELTARFGKDEHGVFLEEISGGYQLRTKLENAEFLRRHVKG